MASFNFDEVDQYVQKENKIDFLKLQDDGWYAKVRFMYGPGETFEAQTVHNISANATRPKYVPCLRGLNQPVESCPLCASGSKIVVQYYIPVYVISIVSKIRGVEKEEPVEKVMLFQRGSSIQGTLQSAIRQADGKALVNTVFNLVRNGKENDPSTRYSAEKVLTDNVGLDQLPPKIQVAGTYILPDVDYNTMMEKYVNNTQSVNNLPNDIVPRTINASTFAGNTVVGGSNFNQVPAQAPALPKF